MSDTPPPSESVGPGEPTGLRTALVTGATGLLGHAVVERLLAGGTEVTNTGWTGCGTGQPPRDTGGGPTG